ncbi:MAG: hypothetical protein ABFD23_06370 [Caldisericales bacterium]|nr:hypothetical protein [bacterium]
MRRITKQIILITVAIVVLSFVSVLVFKDTTISGFSISPPVNTPFNIATIYPFENTSFSGADYAVYVNKDLNNNSIVTRYKIDNGTTTIISSATQAKPAFIYSDDNYANSDFVCWYDFRNTQNNEQKMDVYYYKVSNTTEYRLTSAPEDRSELALLGNYIAYAEYGSANPGIYIKDLTSANQPQRIHNFTKAQCINLVLGTYNGNTVVVFEDQNGTTSDIKMYNIGTSTTTTIANSSTQHEMIPCIQNGRIYFTSINRSNPPKPWPKNELFVTSGSLKEYVISSQTTYTVCTFNNGEFAISVPNTNSADYVVYKKISKDNNNNDVASLYIYNPSSQSSTQIASQTGIGSMTITIVANCCYGKRIVYSKETSDGSDENVYCYDANSSTTTTISSSSNYESFAKISGSTITWTDIQIITSPPSCIKTLRGYIIQ